MSTTLRHVLVGLALVGFAGTIGCQKKAETGGGGADTTMMQDTTTMTPPPAPPPTTTPSESMPGADTSMAHDSM
jgi:hypothetical protein